MDIRNAEYWKQCLIQSIVNFMDIHKIAQDSFKENGKLKNDKTSYDFFVNFQECMMDSITLIESYKQEFNDKKHNKDLTTHYENFGKYLFGAYCGLTYPENMRPKFEQWFPQFSNGLKSILKQILPEYPKPREQWPIERKYK